MPEYIMKKVRCNLGFDEDDHTHDDDIMAMSKEEIFECVCEWEGLIGFAPIIMMWLEDIGFLEV